MKIIPASYEILTPIDGAEILRRIEEAGRVCYKSEGAIKSGSAERFVKRIIESGHESVLEHVSFSVRFTVDRGVTHELVRHRVASYSMESTRYCNYGQDKFGSELTFIRPYFWTDGSDAYKTWKEAMEAAERYYLRLIYMGATAQEARGTLPHSVKADIEMTANLREWRHCLRLRTAKASHPQMREVMIPLLAELKSRIPVIFDDLEAVI